MNFNSIRINHRGFLTAGAKRFVLTENRTGDLYFSVRLVLCDTEPPVVYEGVMTPTRDTEGREVWVGDFSDMRAEGDFYITAGGCTSRQFVVYDGAYSICKRMMLEYYTYQRCGSDLGWNGKCHAEDGYLAETGERVDLAGGYHQSCDLRKSPAGVSIGVLSMLRAALLDSSAWGKRLFADEVAWACDYFVKTVQENGAMYNTLSSPFGWEGRIFYKSPAPSSAQWCVTMILALGSRYFAKSDSERAARYLAAARRSWAYMTGDGRPDGIYRHPDAAPRGMDPNEFYTMCRKGGTADLGYLVATAAEMYRATGEKTFLAAMRKPLKLLLNQQLEGDLAYGFARLDCPDRLMNAACSYAWTHSAPTALLDAYELLEDTDGLGEAIRHAADALVSLSERSPYRLLRHMYSDADLDVRIGHAPEGQEPPALRETMKNLVQIGSFAANGKTVDAYIEEIEKFDPFTSSYAIFLARAANLLGDRRYLAAAQAHLDALLGTNALDSCAVRGVGYNNPTAVAFGQFFPSTPYIPGAIGTPYASLTDISEYDMPLVGAAMHLISVLEEAETAE